MLPSMATPTHPPSSPLPQLTSFKSTFTTMMHHGGEADGKLSF